MLDVDADGARSAAAELAARTDAPVRGIPVDVADPASVDAAFEEIDAHLPPVLAEVNLAGIASPHSFFELTREVWTRVLDVNATGTLLTMQAAARRMVDGGRGGRIVNTSSITAYDGGGTFSKTGYAAAKAAVLGLTRGGARELGEHGITCNAIVPGPIDTDIMGGPLSDDRKATMAGGIPSGRVGTPGRRGRARGLPDRSRGRLRQRRLVLRRRRQAHGVSPAHRRHPPRAEQTENPAEQPRRTPCRTPPRTGRSAPRC